jgi:hypothetical protein
LPIDWLGFNSIHAILMNGKYILMVILHGHQIFVPSLLSMIFRRSSWGPANAASIKI